MFLITCLGEPNTSLLLWETGPERSRVLIDTARECSHVAFEGVFFFGKSVREQKKKKTIVFIERKPVILTSGY